MKTLWLPTLILLTRLSLSAQEGVIDPSIFDGTGKKSVPAEAEALPSGQTAAEEIDSEKPSAEPEETSEAPLPSEEEAEEKELPEEKGGDSSSEEEETEGEAEALESPPGVPSGVGGGESRAGEKVKSTEKIAPGQAVDYPWDM